MHTACLKDMLIYLEIATDDQQIYTVPAIELARLSNGRVYGIKRSMSLY